MTSIIVKSSVGEVRRLGDGAYELVHDRTSMKFERAGDALVALSRHVDDVSSHDVTIEYLIPIKDVLAMLDDIDETELFRNKEAGFLKDNGCWLPAAVDPGVGEPDGFADYVEEWGEMGIHVTLYDYNGVYFVRWSNTVYEEQGFEVLGAVAPEAAEQLASEKADDLGFESDLVLPAGLGLCTLEESDRYELPANAEHCATASTAWPYDTTAGVVVEVYRVVDGAVERWLVTDHGSTTVFGEYETWPELNDAVRIPDGWEAYFDWHVEEPC